MRRFLRWVGYTIGGVLTLIILLVGSVYFLTSRHMSKDYPTAVRPVAIPTDSAGVARGRHIAEAVSNCMNCHGENLAGKILEDDPAFGRLVSSNLTSGRGGVAGGYTDEDWVRAIRHGIGTDGKPLLFMPSEQFINMSDRDLGALIAYLRTVKPVDAVMPPSKVGPVVRALSLFGVFPLVPARLIREDARPHRDIAPAVTPAYGRYLVGIAGCRGCHGDELTGGTPMGETKTANLTPGGIGRWTEADFFRAIRTGTRPDGRVLSAEMPWPYYRRMTDDELRAIWRYLRTLPTMKTGEKAG